MADLLRTAFAKISVEVEQDGEISLRNFLNTNQISEISYDDKRWQLDSATIKIADLSLAQIEEKVLREENIVIIEFGVQGSWVTRKKVIIKKLDWKYGNRIDATITCRGFMTYFLDRKAGKVWGSKTASEIVEDIAAKLGYIAEVVPTEGKVRVVMANKSYATILSELSYLEGYFWVATQDPEPKLIFRPAYEFENAKPDKVYFVGRNPNIREFNIAVNAIRIPSETYGNKLGKGVTAKGVDTKTGAVVSENTAAEETPSVGERGQNYSAITFEKDGSFSAEAVTGSVDVHPSNEEQAKKRSKAWILDAKWYYWEATLLLENLPLVNGDVIEIGGVARQHSGKFVVMGVQSSYRSGKISVSVRLRRSLSWQSGVAPTISSPSESEDDRAPKTRVKFNSDGTFTKQ